MTHDVQPGAGRFSKWPLVEQDAGRRLVAAADTTAKLVQLGEPEAFRVFDDNDGRIRHVDPDLDHGGGDKNLGFAALEGLHCAVFFVGGHASVNEGDLLPECLFQHPVPVLDRSKVDLLRLLDQRADPVDLLSFRNGGAYPADDFIQAVERHGYGGNRLAACGLVRQTRNVHVPEAGQNQCARDRGGCHDENIDALSLRGQGKTLVDAKPVLLVDHDNSQIAEADLALEKGMGPDNQIDLASVQLFLCLPALTCRILAGQKCQANPGLLAKRGHGSIMLAGQDFGRGHDGSLSAGLYDLRCSSQCHNRLA